MGGLGMRRRFLVGVYARHARRARDPCPDIYALPLLTAERARPAQAGTVAGQRAVRVQRFDGSAAALARVPRPIRGARVERVPARSTRCIGTLLGAVLKLFVRSALSSRAPRGG